MMWQFIFETDSIQGLPVPLHFLHVVEAQLTAPYFQVGSSSWKRAFLMLSNLSAERKIELDKKIELDEHYRSSFLHKQANNLRFEEQVCCFILC